MSICAVFLTFSSVKSISSMSICAVFLMFSSLMLVGVEEEVLQHGGGHEGQDPRLLSSQATQRLRKRQGRFTTGPTVNSQ